jgi:hypothetical protein
MKTIWKYVIAASLAIVAAVSLLAQGRSGSNPSIFDNYPVLAPYDVKRPPVVQLSEAYALTLAYMGPATNHFYCVSASCLEKTKIGLSGWSFSFSNTNGERASIDVSFDKVVRVDEHSAQLLQTK